MSVTEYIILALTAVLWILAFDAVFDLFGAAKYIQDTLP